MHIKKQLSLNSAWWHTQMNTSKVLEMDCSILWNQKPRAWQLYIRQLIEGHSKKVSTEDGYRLTDWLCMVLSGCSSCPLQFKGVKTKLGGQVDSHSYRQNICDMNIFTGYSQSFSAVSTFITKWSLDKHCDMRHVNFDSMFKLSYTPIDFSQILDCRFNLSNYYY